MVVAKGWNTLRLMRRSAVNPVGIDLGDSYEVLWESPSALLFLGTKSISLAFDCAIELDGCADYRVELDRIGGSTDHRSVRVFHTYDKYTVFTVVK